MKFTKVLGMLAATSLIFGSLFTSCGGGDDDDDSPSKVKVESITVTAAGEADSVKVEGTLQLTATVAPTNATEKGVTWSSSDETKATVSENGLVTGVAVAEEVTITATAKDGSNKAGTFTLKVLAKDAAPQKYTCTGCGTEYDTETEKDNCSKQENCPKYEDPSKGPQEAPAADKFTATAPTSKDGTDGKITVTAELANLKYKGADGVEHDATEEITGLAAGTYAFYYAATGTLNASANTEVVVEAFVAPFTGFLASELGTANVDTAKQFKSDDETWTIGSGKYQVKDSAGADVKFTFDDTDYVGRVKIQKNNKLTLNNVKIGDVLCIIGGNSNKTDYREIQFTGTDSDSSNWKAGGFTGNTADTFGVYYVTATAATVALEAITNEFAIYAVTIVDSKVAATEKSSTTTYEKPVIALSAESAVKDDEVTITASIPKSTTVKAWSTGLVEKVEDDVTADLTWINTDGYSVPVEGKVDTSAAATLKFAVSYTIGEDTYTSDDVTFEVAGAFEPKTDDTTANTEAVLGLTGTNAKSSDDTVATVAIADGKVKITSAKAGTATISVSDTADYAKKATIAVTVKASGDVEIGTIKPYSAYVFYWDGSTDLKTVTGFKQISGSTTYNEDKSITLSNGYFVLGNLEENITNTTSSSHPDGAFDLSSVKKVIVTYKEYKNAPSKSSGQLSINIDNNTTSASTGPLGNDGAKKASSTTAVAQSGTLEFDVTALVANKTNYDFTKSFVMIRCDSKATVQITKIEIQ